MLVAAAIKNRLLSRPHPLEKYMKVKTNVRAGSQTRNRSSSTSTDSTSTETQSVETVSVPVSRCVGI